MDQGWAALGGALIGGLMAALASWGVDVRRERRHAKNLAIALAGEAAAIAEIVRRRDWLSQIRDYHHEAGQGVVYRMTVQLPGQILSVARASQQDAGALPGWLPALVPRLVLLGDGVAADLNRLFQFHIDDPQGFLRSDHPQGAALVYAELFAVLCAALHTCDLIVAEVKALYPRETASISTTKTAIEELGFPKGI